jgi:hypothetical protein
MTDSRERQASDRVWEVGFAQHDLAQLRRLARMPFHLKLKWLEEAHRTVLSMRGEAVEPDAEDDR